MTKKPDATPQAILSDQLSLCTEALRECFAGARTARSDEALRYRRASELDAAVAILKASAKVGAALAKINGEFRQNIRIEREAQGEGAAKTRGSNGRGDG